VCTPAAYLLFYRRRSAQPLGSPEVQKIVERAMDGEGSESEDATSRSASPSELDKSGNGRRLGDSSPSGSSSALVGPVAARPLHGAGSAGAGPQALQARGKMHQRQQMGVTTLMSRNEDEDELSELHHIGGQSSSRGVGASDDVDEGIGLTMDDDDDEENSAYQHGGSLWGMTAPSWSYTDLAPTVTEHHEEHLDERDADGEDFASDGAVDGSDDGFGASEKMHEEFGGEDDVSDLPGASIMSSGFGQHQGYSAGHSSPMEQSPIVMASIEGEGEEYGEQDELALDHLKKD
jgi:hypothetical protein